MAVDRSGYMAVDRNIIDFEPLVALQPITLNKMWR
jgi:hypothetical protein